MGRKIVNEQYVINQFNRLWLLGEYPMYLHEAWIDSIYKEGKSHRFTLYTRKPDSPELDKLHGANLAIVNICYDSQGKQIGRSDVYNKNDLRIMLVNCLELGRSLTRVMPENYHDSDFMIMEIEVVCGDLIQHTPD